MKTAKATKPASRAQQVETAKLVLASAKAAQKQAHIAFMQAQADTDMAEQALAQCQADLFFSGGPESCLPAGILPIISKSSLTLRQISHPITITGSFEFRGWMQIDIGLVRYHMAVPAWLEWTRERDARREAPKSSA